MFSGRKAVNYWESIADIMTGLMMVFLFVSLAFNYQLMEKTNSYWETKRKIYEDLSQEFSDQELDAWGAKIDPETGEISFMEPEVLFGTGDSRVTKRYQEILNDFFPRYVKTLAEGEYAEDVLEVRIEGHASREWNGNIDSKEAYFYNMKLSQDRARNVLEYAMALWGVHDHVNWLKQKVIAVGYSYGQATDTNMEKSRRVAFRVITNAERRLKMIYDYQ